MNCEYCGSNIPEGATQCPACGAACTSSQPVNSQQQTAVGTERICVFCGAVIPAEKTDRGCPNCGMQIKCSCGKVIEGPMAICPRCKTGSEAFYKLADYLTPERCKLSEIYPIISGVMIFSGLLGLAFELFDKDAVASLVAMVLLLAGLIGGVISSTKEERIKKNDPEYQSMLKMLKEDDSFFQSKWQEYIMRNKK